MEEGIPETADNIGLVSERAPTWLEAATDKTEAKTWNV
jgi:hypothetical protein